LQKGQQEEVPLIEKDFFEISRSSLVEIDSQLEISHNLGYLNEKNIHELEPYLEEIFTKISNLIKSTK